MRTSIKSVTLNQVMANVIRMKWETKLDNVIIMKE